MKRTISILISSWIFTLPATAQDGPYVVGTGGNLYKGIEPEIYLQGSGIDYSPYEWCFWPLGCMRSEDEQIVPLSSGSGFDPESFGHASSEELDFYSGETTVPTLDLQLFEQPITQ